MIQTYKPKRSIRRTTRKATQYLKEIAKKLTYHNIVASIKKNLSYYNNRYKLTLSTKTFVLIITVIGILNSPAVPGGVVLNPFIDKILGRLL